MLASTVRRSTLPLLALALLTPALGFAQTDCNAGSGPLRTEVNVPDERALIEKVAAKESAAVAARRNYSFEQEVTIQTLLDPQRGKPIVDGEFRQVMEVGYDEHGKRTERVTFAPQNSLRRIAMMPSDLEDIRNFAIFSLTTEELPHYAVRYLGGQHVDDLDTYVFEIAPRTLEKDKRYFQGKLWVEVKDLDVVKSCGRSVPDTVIDKKKQRTDKHPTFATYREQMEGGFWFPTYSRSDEYMDFGRNGVHVREVIKFKNYQKGAKPAGNWQSFDKKP
jgi:hypothetical protein